MNILVIIMVLIEDFLLIDWVCGGYFFDLYGEMLFFGWLLKYSLL